MKIEDIFRNTEASFPSMLSEIIETQCMLKGMLSSIIAELADGNPDKEQKIVDLANKLKDQELLRVVGRFAKENDD